MKLIPQKGLKSAVADGSCGHRGEGGWFKDTQAGSGRAKSKSTSLAPKPVSQPNPVILSDLASLLLT